MPFCMVPICSAIAEWEGLRAQPDSQRNLANRNWEIRVCAKHYHLLKQPHPIGKEITMKRGPLR